jgi:hypothetical protein
MVLEKARNGSGAFQQVNNALANGIRPTVFAHTIGEHAGCLSGLDILSFLFYGRSVF